jgi:hypothetical protein
MNQVGQLNGHSSNSLAGVSTAANGQLSLPLNGQIKGRPPHCLRLIIQYPGAGNGTCLKVTTVGNLTVFFFQLLGYACN